MKVLLSGTAGSDRGLSPHSIAPSSPPQPRTPEQTPFMAVEAPLAESILRPAREPRPVARVDVGERARGVRVAVQAEAVGQGHRVLHDARQLERGLVVSRVEGDETGHGRTRIEDLCRAKGID